MTQIYCTKSDIDAIWPPADVLASVDDDGNGTLSATEASYIDRAIERAAEGECQIARGGEGVSGRVGDTQNNANSNSPLSLSPPRPLIFQQGNDNEPA